MSGNILIRPAYERDVAALARIYAYYVEKTAITFEHTVPDAAEMERRRQAISQQYPYLVAEVAGKVIGYAYAHAFYGREAYAWSVESSIYVDVNVRKHGIGRTLYKALEEALKSMGILNINACIAIPRDEDDPYVTYDSLNFHKHLAISWQVIFTTAATNSTAGTTLSGWKKCLAPIPFIRNSQQKNEVLTTSHCFFLGLRCGCQNGQL